MSPDGSRLVVAGASHSGDHGVVLAYDAATMDQRWEYVTEDGVDGGFTEIDFDPDGTIYVTGHRVSGIQTQALDEDGNQVWRSELIKGPASAGSLEVGPSGEAVYVLARVQNDFMTIAYDADDGSVLWSDQYDHIGGWENPRDLTVGPNGERVYVTGAVLTSNRANFQTLAYDTTTGALSWTAHLDDGGSQDPAWGVATSLDGSTVYVGGYSNADLHAVAYDATTGEEEWDLRRHTTTRDVARASIAVNPADGSLIVAGTQDWLQSSADILVWAVKDGAEKWAATYDGPGEDQDLGLDVATGPDGQVYVTGFATGPTNCQTGACVSTGRDIVTVAYDEDGNQQWVGRYNGLANSVDFGRAVAVAPDGGTVYTSGFSRSLELCAPGGLCPVEGGDHDIVTMAFEATGPPQDLLG